MISASIKLHQMHTNAFFHILSTLRVIQPLHTQIPSQRELDSVGLSAWHYLLNCTAKWNIKKTANKQECT